MFPCSVSRCSLQRLRCIILFSAVPQCRSLDKFIVLCYDDCDIDQLKGGNIMARVIMTCGKLCSGKSTYARKLQKERNAVLLSIDELMLALFPEGAGEDHDIYVQRTKQYLLCLSLQILQAGRDVILDWGLWTKAQRGRLRAFYAEYGIESEIHYLHVSDEEWQRRIRKRNSEKDPSDYYVDEGLLKKFENLFEEPEQQETDLIVEN